MAAELRDALARTALAPAIRDAAEAGIRYAARSAHRDGSCDDYYPFERAAGAAGFSLYACLEAARILGLEGDAEINAFVQRRAQWLADHRESGQLSNHEALIVRAGGAGPTGGAPPAGARWRMSRRLIALGVSALILAVLWWRVDPAAIWSAVGAADLGWLLAGLAAVIPLTLATAWRFQLLSRGALGAASSVRLILSSSTLNLVLPSKLGDFAKALVLTRRHGFGGEMALAIVVLEKLLDMASLLVWGVVALLWIAGGRIELLLAAAAVGGLLLLLIVLLLPLPFAAALMARIGGLLPGKPARMLTGFADEWHAVLQWFWGERARATVVVLVSLAAWAGHLAQFWLFARALDASVPLIDNMAYASLSILIGLAPFTIAGIGTRDVAIVFFYGPWLDAGQGAVLGLLATTRYLLPAIAGLPFIGDYVDAARSAKVQAPEGQEPVRRKPCGSAIGPSTGAGVSTGQMGRAGGPESG